MHTSMHSRIPQQGGGWAITLEAVLNKVTSAALLLTNPGNTCPPALFHFGNSSSATVFGFSPLFNLLTNVDDPEFPHPTLNAQETSAPYWLALSLTLSAMSRAIQFWYVRRSEASRAEAVVVVRGKG